VIDVSIHLWWGAALSAGAAAATAWCYLTTRLDMMSQKLPYMMWSCLCHSLSLYSESELEWL
jgi:hypothetical protein